MNMPEDEETSTKTSQDWSKCKALLPPHNIPGHFQLCTSVFSKKKCRLYRLKTQSLLVFCAHGENEHSPKISVLQRFTEMMRQDQEQTPMFLSSFTLQVELDRQTVNLKNVFLLSPYLYFMGLANQPITNQPS